MARSKGVPSGRNRIVTRAGRPAPTGLLPGEQLRGVRGVDGSLGPGLQLVEVGAGLDSFADGVGHGDGAPFEDAQRHFPAGLDVPLLQALLSAFLAYLFGEWVAPEVLDGGHQVPPHLLCLGVGQAGVDELHEDCGTVGIDGPQGGCQGFQYGRSLGSTAVCHGREHREGYVPFGLPLVGDDRHVVRAQHEGSYRQRVPAGEAEADRAGRPLGRLAALRDDDEHRLAAVLLVQVGQV